MRRIVIAMLLVAWCWSSAADPGQDFAAQMQLLETWVGELMAYYRLPGLAIGVVRDQELVYAKGFGYADLRTKAPVTPRTLFRVASITKLFTATAVMQLRDAGKLALDDPVQKYLPWFSLQGRRPEWPAVTIRQLLTHTSGIPREAAFPYWTDHRFPAREEMVAKLPTQEMVFQPETRWKYSNLGMALLGEIVAVVSGTPYTQYVTEHILRPLGMNSSLLEVAPGTPGLATGYLRHVEGKGREVAPFTDARGLTAAANLASNLEDMGRFCALQFRYDDFSPQAVLKGSTLREMHRVHWLRPDWQSGYGLGFSVRRVGGRTVVGHAGWVAGYRSQVLLAPEEKVAAIVFCNTEDFDPNTIAVKALGLAAETLGAKPAKVPSAFDSTWVRFVGAYEDPTHWRTDVLLLGTRLYLYGFSYPPEDDPTEALVELEPIGPATFRRASDGEPVSFEMDARGRVLRVKVGENFIYPIR
ncbi:MAG: beta-lactamase family protein [candidate division KSB1 bacterium]|nr:beta-lactamase family protein [candidate division KSB1 bacterium]MDZ7392671.1 beta-lactamase family protein [candidate division KSB1 bacterium]MDZ7412939.1 beta-lactamase family protein [candidate division KSB1 bacterium]